MEGNKLYETLLGIPLLSITKVEIAGNILRIHCESKLASGHCPCCLKPRSRVNQQHIRVIRDLPISGRKVHLHLTSRQFICSECNRTFYENFAFVNSYERMSVRYEDFIYNRCIGAELRYVSLQEDLVWHTVNRIFKKWSDEAINQADLFSRVRALGVDEIALKKGHKDFVCVLVNLETGEVLDILEDRSKANLISYFQKMGSEFCNKIEVFSSDMWEGYINAAKILFPNASIVADRFHFFAHLQKALDNCRKALRRMFPERVELKNVKWLFLKNGVDLTPQQQIQLTTLLEHTDYASLKEAYQAKEDFRAILEADLTLQQAGQKLTDWVLDVLNKKNKFLDKFIKTFTHFYDYILNYFNGKWSNGIVEGINNRIKMIKRRAFGYDDFQNFRRRVLVEFL